MSKPIIYRLDDNISFRKCTLAEGYNEFDIDDCTNFKLITEWAEPVYKCNQHGIHLHCTKHPGIELDSITEHGFNHYLRCKECRKLIPIESFQTTLNECRKLLNIEKFKTAKLIRLDDWYTPEIKEKIDLIGTNYWMKSYVKTDKDNNTVIVLYIGNTDSKEKAQIFIKPEKLQVSSDHKDLDPSTVLSKIEVTLKGRTIKQEYDEDC